jgi:DNA-binding MarR family transcriptional regulator
LRKLNLSPATLNQTVNSIEERGLVRRTRQMTDTRKVSICATAEGEGMQNSASQEFHTFMSSLFGRMLHPDATLYNGNARLRLEWIFCTAHIWLFNSLKTFFVSTARSF